MSAHPTRLARRTKLAWIAGAASACLALGGSAAPDAVDQVRLWAAGGSDWLLAAGAPDPTGGTLPGLQAQLRASSQADVHVGQAITDSAPDEVTVVLAGTIAYADATYAGPSRLTLGKGSADGLRDDLTVVTAGGLVGRTSGTRTHSCDVLLIGSGTDSVAVRTPTGDLAIVGTAAPPGVTRRSGELTVTMMSGAVPTAGAALSTLGSLDERPYVRGVAVGVITTLDPDRGDAQRTAAVRLTGLDQRLDVLGVILP